MKKLLLFDIDGTLLTTDGAAGRAFEAALIDVYGTAGPIDEVSFAGKTDPQIAHELLAGAGLSRDQVEAALDNLWARYLDHFDRTLSARDLRVFDGVGECLARIDDSGGAATPGLLTGNIERGARRKLDTAGLGFDRFRCGGFGSDSEHRDDLPAIAVDRAHAATGHRFAAPDVVVVGDTPADIGCGRAFGARTLAVATGVYSFDELAACEPDFLFDSLEDTTAVWRAMIS